MQLSKCSSHQTNIGVLLVLVLLLSLDVALSMPDGKYCAAATGTSTDTPRLEGHLSFNATNQTMVASLQFHHQAVHEVVCEGTVFVYPSPGSVIAIPSLASGPSTGCLAQRLSNIGVSMRLVYHQRTRNVVAHTNVVVANFSPC